MATVEARGETAAYYARCHGEQGFLAWLEQLKGFPTKDPIVRASWNHLLIQNDGSKRVRNPTYTRQVLLATLNALQ
ncbi:uncharacterized protein TTMY_0908 [Thermus thermophilus]|uniref:hypothetical protein n=1 Tax=Thermus thermophilus TaxID=274 RepID=UPI00090A321E|nr:hypothetical protein [Thermus thermophilus]BAW01312.1 uncharacterized protein TTMY_0908 [Thermus thermophilus]BDB11954.1 hypothetical protein TthTMY_16930 [Thermus thermophilus]